MIARIIFAISVLFCLLATPLKAQALPDFAQARDEAVQVLQNLVRIDTSNPPGNETKVAEYLKSILDREGISSEVVALEAARGNLIARIKGNGKKRPLLLMGHEDTVGVERDKWTVDPFAGLIKDGYVYGRGALDDKSGLAAMLQVFLMLHRQKLPLDRDIIFLAEAGEEGGPPVGINFLVEQHWPKIECEFALNEVSGHGSVPRLDNPILHLARAIAKVGEYQPPLRWTETTRVFFQRLAKVSSPEEAFLFTHLEDPAMSDNVQEILQQSTNPTALSYNSMLHTSISPNIIKGGFRTNVIPAEAEATLDVRLLPGETREDLIEELRGVIKDEAVEVLPADFASMPPSPPSRLDSEMFRSLEKAQAVVFPGSITLPLMSTGATDSAELRRKGIQAYGVDPPVTDEDEGRMHGNDERLSIDGLGKFVEYIYRAVAEVAAGR